MADPIVRDGPRIHEQSRRRQESELKGAGELEAATRTRSPAPIPARRNAPQQDCEVRLLHGRDLTPEPICWLWEGWLARGKFHIVAGAPGTGKTTLALALAATIAAGGRWPDGARAESGHVLIWSGEDGVCDTLFPRLLAMGADWDRVHFVDVVLADSQVRPFDPARDMDALARQAGRVGDVRLLIVDPVVTVVSGDSHKNSETRRSLQPVVDLAARLGAAALGVSHFTKGTAGRDPIERVTGSLAFGALPRLVFGTAKKTDESGHTEHRLVRAKSNIGPDGGGYSYDLEQKQVPGFPDLVASCVVWGASLEGAAKELLATVEEDEDREERTAVAEAGNWLAEVLREGAVEAKEIRRLADAQGFAWRTVHRAREQIGAVSQREGFGKGSRVLWSIRAKDHHTCHPKGLAPMGSVGTYVPDGDVEADV